VPLFDINKAGIFFGNKLSFLVATGPFCCASLLTINEMKIIPRKRIDKYFFIQLY
jgi:hypothetical protein